MFRHEVIFLTRNFSVSIGLVPFAGQRFATTCAERNVITSTVVNDLKSSRCFIIVSLVYVRACIRAFDDDSMGSRFINSSSRSREHFSSTHSNVSLAIVPINRNIVQFLHREGKQGYSAGRRDLGDGERCDLIEKTPVADTHRLRMTVSWQWNVIAAATTTEHLAAVSAMMSSSDYRETGVARHATRCIVVRYPRRGTLHTLLAALGHWRTCSNENRMKFIFRKKSIIRTMARQCMSREDR